MCLSKRRHNVQQVDKKVLSYYYYYYYCYYNYQCFLLYCFTVLVLLLPLSTIYSFNILTVYNNNPIKCQTTTITTTTSENIHNAARTTTTTSTSSTKKTSYNTILQGRKYNSNIYVYHNRVSIFTLFEQKSNVDDTILLSNKQKKVRKKTGTTTTSTKQQQKESLSNSTKLQQQQQQQNNLLINREGTELQVIMSMSLSEPLYITIGPPCCGKTTWGKKEHMKKNGTNNKEIKMQDIALDDQDGVYVPLPLYDYFIPSTGSTTSDTTNNSTTTKQQQQQQQQQNRCCFPSIDTILYGQTIQDRINSIDQRELIIVLERLTNNIDTDTFVYKIKQLQIQLQQTKMNSNTLQHQQSSSSSFSEKICTDLIVQYQILIQVVEDIISSSIKKEKSKTKKKRKHTTSIIKLPETIDLFVREAIFRLPGNNDDTTTTTATTTTTITTTTGIERATHALYNVPYDTAVMWGNTNTKPNDYKTAIVMAYQQKRPIHFVLYNDNDNHTTNSNNTKDFFRTNNNVDDTDTTTNDYENHLFELGLSLSDSSLDDTLKNNNTNTNTTSNTTNTNTKYLCYKELVRRNIYRLQETGRYVPVTVIWDMRQRCIDLLQQVLHVWQQQNQNKHATTKLTKFEIDKILARFVNFQLHDNRLVTIISNNNNNNNNSNEDRNYNNNNNNNNNNKRHYNTVDNVRRIDDSNKRTNVISRPWDRSNSNNNNNNIQNRNHYNIQQHQQQQRSHGTSATSNNYSNHQSRQQEQQYHINHTREHSSPWQSGNDRQGQGQYQAPGNRIDGLYSTRTTNNRMNTNQDNFQDRRTEQNRSNYTNNNNNNNNSTTNRRNDSRQRF